MLNRTQLCKNQTPTDYCDGYELGVEDCTRGIPMRFTEDHSDFAIGYSDGYKNHVQYMKQYGEMFDEADDYDKFEEN